MPIRRHRHRASAAPGRPGAVTSRGLENENSPTGNQIIELPDLREMRQREHVIGYDRGSLDHFFSKLLRAVGYLPGVRQASGEETTGRLRAMRLRRLGQESRDGV